MSIPVSTRSAVLLACTVVGLGYLITSVRQRDALNLSATAGGQYPYLVYAWQMAREGWWGHFGDRNRMPLFPAMLSLVYVDDWDAFVRRSANFAIASSVVVLLLIAVAARRFLSTLATGVFVCVLAVTVFARYASFVQAELLFYGLFFISWLLLCRELRRPTLVGAALAGGVLGLCYLSKASALPMLIAFLAVASAMMLSSMLRGVSRKISASGKESSQNGSKQREDLTRTVRIRGFDPNKARVASRAADGLILERSTETRVGSRSIALSAALTTICFLAVCFPYLKSNYDRFGTPFYNVNSTFYMWCDSWSEAVAFSKKYAIDRHYPTAPSDQIPSPVRYWREHSIEQIVSRLGYGLRTLSSHIWREPCFKYLLLLSGLAVLQIVRRPRSFLCLGKRHRACLVFTALLFFGYAMVYAWYAQVAYGERFVLSLLLLALFGPLWLIDQTTDETDPGNVQDPWAEPSAAGIRSVRGGEWLLTIVLVLLVAESTLKAAAKPKSDPTFITFYFNESKARELLGDGTEAERGYRGVLTLDPEFGAAHQGLGMIALARGQTAEAVASLRRAVELMPDSADAHNCLGSALFQSSDTSGSIAAFEKAVRLDPGMVAAWYNLGGAYWTVGDAVNADRVLNHLAKLDEALAGQLATMMRNEAE